MKNEIFKTHIFYIITILVGIIILLTSVKWGGIEKLVEYITFALTLTSLVLALLAIIYAVFSNSKFVQNITALNNITSDVNNASNYLNEVTNELKTKIELIPTSLKKVEDKTQETNELVREMSLSSNKISQPESKMKNEKTDPNEKNKTAINLTSFSSFTGKLVLLASNLSMKTSTSFSLDELFNEDNNYVYGSIVSLQAIGIIKFTYKDGIVSVLELNEYIANHIEKNIIKAADKYDKDNNNDINDESSWTFKVEKIKNNFKE